MAPKGWPTADPAVRLQAYDTLKGTVRSLVRTSDGPELAVEVSGQPYSVPISEDLYRTLRTVAQSQRNQEDA